MGAAGQVAANHPGAGVLLEGLLAPVRVDPCGTPKSMGDAPSAIGRRVVVTGMAGTGKSFNTFFSAAPGMDEFFWGAGLSSGPVVSVLQAVDAPGTFWT
jgi:hypothetical protein